jgi:hypothetical protein
MHLTDDVDTATALFNVMNFIVEQQPRQLQALYENLPMLRVARSNSGTDSVTPPSDPSSGSVSLDPPADLSSGGDSGP